MAKMKEAAACDYLGAGVEPTVSFGFASPNNYCYRASPPEAIRLTYQESVCLPANCRNCPVYQSDWHGPLPREIAGPQGSRRGLGYFSALILGFGVVLLMLWYASTLLFPKDRPSITEIQSSPVAAMPIQEGLTVLGAALPTQVSLIVPTGTQIFTPAATIAPAAPTETTTAIETTTATETSIPPEMSTPTEALTPTTIVCAPPANWVRYTVQPGDSLALFRQIFNLRKIDLLAANCIPTQVEVFVGQIFYLPYLPPDKVPGSNLPNPTANPLPPPPDERPPEPPPSRP
jgi:hypothetical protein